MRYSLETLRFYGGPGTQAKRGSTRLGFLDCNVRIVGQSLRVMNKKGNHVPRGLSACWSPPMQAHTQVH